MSRPLLFMDVDGVLNPFPDTPPGFDELDLFPEDREPVRLHPAHGDWLRELAEVFDVVWATGWGEDANSRLCPHFGLEPFELLALPAVPFTAEEKVPAVAACAGVRPAAWVDDLLGPAARAWAAARESPTLLVEVDSETGLTRPAVDRLLAWARALPD
jgi:HAD domain in Swiss Army Knife RNA repair proteins